jgi:RNA polymerase sigma-70 factor (ECF subfamily)
VALAARRLQRKYALPPADRDDLRQDLLADLIRCLPAYDPTRGSLGSFAGLVLRHHAIRIARRMARERRASGGAFLPLDEPAADGLTLAERIADDVALPGWQAPGASRIADAERRVDVARMLPLIELSDHPLCAALGEHAVDEIARHRFGSRAGIYRRLRDIRCVLTAHGLRAA